MRLFARLSTCILLGLSPALLGHCGGATNGGLMGTETGNPPVVDSQKLRLVAGAAGVELIGQAGAVSPGAQVRLHNRSTGASAEVTASSDGSFRVDLPGTALDSYEVSVTHEGGTISVPVSVERAEQAAESRDGDPIGLSCEQLENGLGFAVNDALAPFATGCTRHSDCELQFWSVGCYYQCGYSYVLAGQQAAAVAAAEQSIAPMCGELESRCLREPPASCPLPAPVPECAQGTCRALSLDGLGCTDLQTRADELAGDAIARAERSCNGDADCVTVRAVSCASSCVTSAVAASALAAVQQSLESVERSLCSTFSGRACTPTAPPCSAPRPDEPTAVCVENQCSLRLTP